MRATIQLFGLVAIACVVAAVGATPASAKCTRLAFSVNDYGKDGPTKDARRLLDGYIRKWTAERSIEGYRVGKKDVNCELFLDFVVFDEYTCRAEATVCWGDQPAKEQRQEADSGQSKTAEQAPVKATTGTTGSTQPVNQAETAPLPAVETAMPQVRSVEKIAPPKVPAAKVINSQPVQSVKTAPTVAPATGQAPAAVKLRPPQDVAKTPAAGAAPAGTPPAAAAAVAAPVVTKVEPTKSVVKTVPAGAPGLAKSVGSAQQKAPPVATGTVKRAEPLQQRLHNTAPVATGTVKRSPTPRPQGDSGGAASDVLPSLGH